MKGTLKSVRRLQKRYIGKMQRRNKRPLNRLRGVYVKHRYLPSLVCNDFYQAVFWP